MRVQSNRFFKLFQKFEKPHSGAKTLFRHAEKSTAEALVKLAEENNTPFFSTSALRFADELKTLSKEGIVYINSRGPGNFDTYAIHQLEPMLMLMGSNVSRVMSVGSGKYEYSCSL